MLLNKTEQWMLNSPQFQFLLTNLSPEAQVSFVRNMGFPEASKDWNILALTQRLYTLQQKAGLLVPKVAYVVVMDEGAVNACRPCYETHSRTWELDSSGGEELATSGCIGCHANEPETDLVRVLLPLGSCRVCQGRLRQSPLSPFVDLGSDTFLCQTCSLDYGTISTSHSVLNHSEHASERSAQLRRLTAALKADFDS